MKRNFWTHIKQHHQLNVNPESLFSRPFIVHIQIGIYTYIRYTNIVENDWQMVETVRRKPFFALFPSFFLPTVWRMDNKTHLIYISNGFRMNQIPNSVECIDGIFIFPISTSEMMNVWVCECECECDCDGFCVCVCERVRVSENVYILTMKLTMVWLRPVFFTPHLQSLSVVAGVFL